MSTTISKDDIFLISQIMNSQEGAEICGYIDRETGEVAIGSYNDLWEIIPHEEDENYEELEAEFEIRYLPIPRQGSRDSYRDMVDFIETVADEGLRELLEVAIQGRRVFGRFKDVLRRSEYESECKRWFAFRDKCEYDRVVEWLTAEGLSVEA